MSLTAKSAENAEVFGFLMFLIALTYGASQAES
jgi:hypothetical protein